ncbi:Hcp family type VI secretion system effector [Shewanella cyperi]|uniref:Type VI secretion system tube protein Hcp n=1 Tax=Shewanella cyperi TaxID=2814292 RepID=A0A975AK40_9GAMM|nr:type VI secretion system tube protein Hcp [Shewanella cyperi]QSX29341.1 type VI secretion system tube protein Hcp [Shewanella cyperi]QSX40092.1 type VI secretion system tube protein Hcp [Shewanella cyperi]
MKLSLGLLALALTITNAQGAAFLKIGDIKGESTAPSHQDEIDLLAWSWGANGNLQTKCIEELHIIKYTDSATVDLLLGQMTDTVFPEAKLSMNRQGDKRDYFELRLKNVTVSDYSSGVNGEQNRLTESLNLNFSEITVSYRRQMSDGNLGEPEETTLFPSKKCE